MSQSAAVLAGAAVVHVNLPAAEFVEPLRGIGSGRRLPRKYQPACLEVMVFRPRWG